MGTILELFREQQLIFAEQLMGNSLPKVSSNWSERCYACMFEIMDVYLS